MLALPLPWAGQTQSLSLPGMNEPHWCSSVPALISPAEKQGMLQGCPNWGSRGTYGSWAVQAHVPSWVNIRWGVAGPCWHQGCWAIRPWEEARQLGRWGQRCCVALGPICTSTLAPSHHGVMGHPGEPLSSFVCEALSQAFLLRALRGVWYMFGGSQPYEDFKMWHVGSRSLATPGIFAQMQGCAHTAEQLPDSCWLLFASLEYWPGKYTVPHTYPRMQVGRRGCDEMKP